MVELRSEARTVGASATALERPQSAMQRPISTPDSPAAVVAARTATDSAW